MSRQILQLSNKASTYHLALHVPDKWDYWTSDGKRVNFRIRKLNNPEYPDYTGFTIILWVFNLYCVWRKLK